MLLSVSIKIIAESPATMRYHEGGSVSNCRYFALSAHQATGEGGRVVGILGTLTDGRLSAVDLAAIAEDSRGRMYTITAA